MFILLKIIKRIYLFFFYKFKKHTRVHIKIARIIREIMKKNTKRKLYLLDSKAYFKATIIKPALY